MSSSAKRMVILGGARMLGTALVHEAVEQGWDVTVFNRGLTPHDPYPDGVAHKRGDRADPDALASLAADVPDAVADLSSYEPEHVELALDAFAGRCGRYLLMSSGAVYAPQPILPWTEATPLGSDALWGPYGAKKLQIERLAARYADKVPVVLLRPPYIVGVRDHMRRLQFILDRLAAGEPIFLSDTGRAALQFAAPRDVARASCHVFQLEVSSWEAFNVAGRQWTTLAGLVELLARALGVDASHVQPVALDEVGLSNAPFSWSDMVFPFADRDFVLDCTKLEATGFTHETTLEELLNQVAARHQPGPVERYPSERRALDLLAATS